MIIKCSVSLGELVDKITILEIKKEMIQDLEKLKNISNELDELNTTLQALSVTDDDLISLKSELKNVNLKLWKIEDDIRDKEADQCFDETFIALARSVYISNDERFKLKNLINMRYNSSIKEVKSYKGY